MKIIDFDTIKNKNFDIMDYFRWAEHVLLNKRNYILPPKISMKKEGNIFINVMPSIIDDDQVAGVKVVSRYPKRIPSLNSQILLYNSETGVDLALMDGNIITAYRTAAVANIALQKLAVSDYETVSIIGLGNIAYAFMNIFNEILDHKIKMKIFRYKDQAEKFVERYKDNSNIVFEIIDTYEDLIKNSDIIISCVTSIDVNFGKDEWFKKGCLVIPIHTLGFQNCDLFFDKVIVDDIGHVKHFKYFDKFNEVYELTDILLKEKKGRVNNQERIIAYNIGNSIFDIYFAKQIYDACLEDSKLDIDLKEPKTKLWL